VKGLNNSSHVQNKNFDENNFRHVSVQGGGGHGVYENSYKNPLVGIYNTDFWFVLKFHVNRLITF